MRRMKKIIVFFLSVLMIVGSVQISFAAEDEKPTIIVENAIGMQGDTVKVDISIKNNPGIISMGFTLSYGSELTLTSVEDAGILNGEESEHIYSKNPYKFNWTDQYAKVNNTANGKIATLTFEIDADAENGIIPLEITPVASDILDVYLDRVAFSAVNGSVTVGLIGATYDENANSLSIVYEGDTNEKKSVMVYTGGLTATDVVYDPASHLLLGIDQAESGNTFVVPLPKRYTGYIVIAVGTENNAAVRHSISLINSVPDTITTIMRDEEIILTKTVTVAQGAVLDNVTIDLEEGGVLKYINNRGEALDVKGDIWFNAESIEPQENRGVVTLEMDYEDGKAFGFITKDYVSKQGTYKIGLSKGNTTKYADFAISAGIEGTIKFAVGVTGIGADEIVNFESATFTSAQ